MFGVGRYNNISVRNDHAIYGVRGNLLVLHVRSESNTLFRMHFGYYYATIIRLVVMCVCVVGFLTS